MKFTQNNEFIEYIQAYWVQRPPSPGKSGLHEASCWDFSLSLSLSPSLPLSLTGMQARIPLSLSLHEAGCWDSPLSPSPCMSLSLPLLA
jgi:hypothetical protein